LPSSRANYTQKKGEGQPESRHGRGYLQQQHPPQSSPRQQHFSQQQASPEQVQEHAFSAWTTTGLRKANGRMARTMDLKVMGRG